MSSAAPTFSPPTPLLSRQTQLRSTLEGIADLVHIALATSYAPENRPALLECYDQLRQASPQARARVLSDPRTSCWVDRGNRFAIARHPELLANGPWRRHLEDLGRFALASALLDGVAFSTRVPIDPSCRLVLPGTRVALTVRGGWRPRVNVTLNDDGQITLDGQPTLPDPLTFASGFRITAEESSLRPRALDGFEPLNFDRIDLDQWAMTLTSVRGIVDKHKPSKELVTAFATTIVPLKPAPDDKHVSVSFSECPGVVYLAFSPIPYVIAEAMVHEADHQWHNAIGQQHQLWRGASAGRPACYRSPWRPDPRPLDGLLLGASAFVSVGEMWVELARQRDDYAGSRAVFVLSQSLEALAQVKTFGDLTDAGRGLVNWLETRARTALDVLRTSTEFHVWQGTASGRMEKQKTAWKRKHQHPNFTVPGLLPAPAGRFPGATPDSSGGTLEFSGIFIDLDTPHAPAALLEIDGMRDVLYRRTRANSDQSDNSINAAGALANQILRIEESWSQHDFESCIAATMAALRYRPSWLFLWWRLGGALRALGYAELSRSLLFETDSVADIFWAHLINLKERPTAALVASIDLRS